MSELSIFKLLIAITPGVLIALGLTWLGIVALGFVIFNAARGQS